MENYKSLNHLYFLLEKKNIKDVINCLDCVVNERKNDFEFCKRVRNISARFSDLNKNLNLEVLTRKEGLSESNQIVDSLENLIEEYKQYFENDDIIHIPQYADFKDLLNELGTELASNYYQVSFFLHLLVFQVFAKRGNSFFIKLIVIFYDCASINRMDYSHGC